MTMRGSADGTRVWRVWLVVPAAAIVGVLAFVAMTLAATPAHAQGVRALAACPQQPVAGQHVYDCAGVLTASEISGLETRAQSVQQAGAPVVVYLQVKSATYDQAQSDAADLMNRWDVESKPGAKDGVVILFDLTPGNTQHGEVALYAGQTQLNGPLPQSELNSIYQNDMLPDLKSGDMTAAIGAGLDSITSDLTNSGSGNSNSNGANGSNGSYDSSSTYSPAENLGNPEAQVIGGWPFNILALLLVAAVIWIGLADERQAHAAMRELDTTPTTTPPADLKPAVAGALITGQVGGAQMEATIMDFARRGLLHIDTTDDGITSLRLVGNGQGLTGYEKELWAVLVTLVKGEENTDRTISSGRMYLIAEYWQPAVDALRSELYENGWYDTERHERQAPLFGLALLTGVLGGVGLVLSITAQSGWPLLGALINFVAAIAAIAFAYSIPAVTSEGLRKEQEARNYLAGINAAWRGVRLDESNEALPYFVATHQGHSFSSLHIARDAQRHAGAIATTAVATPVALYSSWLLMHECMTPPPPPPTQYSGSSFYRSGFRGGGFSSGGFSGGGGFGGGGGGFGGGGGAAGGGGGGGGSF